MGSEASFLVSSYLFITPFSCIILVYRSHFRNRCQLIFSHCVSSLLIFLASVCLFDRFDFLDFYNKPRPGFAIGFVLSLFGIAVRNERRPGTPACLGGPSGGA